jgi:hypothetical protein
MPNRRPTDSGRTSAWRRKAMTPNEAREVLGFPPFYMPSESELNKAVRIKARDAHPDRGGSTEAMMEINVAKEVLEGKRVNDATIGPDIKQRRADLAAIESARLQAARAMKPVLDRARFFLFPSWRVDLREWLADTYAVEVDKMHDLAEKSVKAATPEDVKVWKDVERQCGVLMGQAMRIATKLGTLSKRLKGEADPTVEGLEGLCSELAKVVDQFLTLHKSSGTLMKVLNTTETVPFEASDAFGDNHSMIDSFKTDFQSYSSRANDCDLGDVKKDVRAAVSAVMDILQRRGSATATLPSWEHWDSSVFTHAATLVDRRTNASRVAARFLETERRL